MYDVMQNGIVRSVDTDIAAILRPRHMDRSLVSRKHRGNKDLVHLNVIMTAQELASLKDCKRRLGHGYGYREAISFLLHYGADSVDYASELQKTRIAIIRVGTNLNQIAHKFNSTGDAPRAAELASVLAEIGATLRLVNETIQDINKAIGLNVKKRNGDVY